MALASEERRFGQVRSVRSETTLAGMSARPLVCDRVTRLCRQWLRAYAGALFGAALIACSATPPMAAMQPAAFAGNGAAGQPALGSSSDPDPITAEGPLPLNPAAPPLRALDAGAPDVCNATSVRAEKVPVDVFMMIDQSLSMLDPDISGNTRWASITDALTQFVHAKDSAGFGVGLQYFGLGLAGVSCAPEDYAMPEVEIGALPGNADAITDSIAAHIPSSVTPTLAALQGALMHASSYKLQHPTHAVVVLLVTDGEPDFCGLVDDTAAAAQASLNATPSIPTYVLGVGAALDALHQIAQAGGSDHAYIVDGTQDVSTQVLQALDQIRNSVALPCEFVAPHDPGTPFDPTKVNLSYTPSGGSEMVISYSSDASKADSATMAWHYDDPAAPTKLVLGANTCKAVTSGGGTIGISLQCPTIELK
jgi:hypothetical protein